MREFLLGHNRCLLSMRVKNGYILSFGIFQTDQSKFNIKYMLPTFANILKGDND